MFADPLPRTERAHIYYSSVLGSEGVWICSHLSVSLSLWWWFHVYLRCFFRFFLISLHVLCFFLSFLFWGRNESLHSHIIYVFHSSFIWNIEVMFTFWFDLMFSHLKKNNDIFSVVTLWIIRRVFPGCLVSSVTMETESCESGPQDERGDQVSTLYCCNWSDWSDLLSHHEPRWRTAYHQARTWANC